MLGNNYKLLEQKRINGRTLVCWYSEDIKNISIALFSDYQVNKLSFRSEKNLLFGYPTLFITGITTTQEASEVVSLYLQDMEKEQFWWEKDDDGNSA